MDERGHNELRLTLTLTLTLTLSRTLTLTLKLTLTLTRHNELSLKRVLDAEWSCLLDELADEPNPNPPVSDEWRPHGPHVGSRVSLHFDGLGAS